MPPYGRRDSTPISLVGMTRPRDVLHTRQRANFPRRYGPPKGYPAHGINSKATSWWKVRALKNVFCVRESTF